MARVSLPKVRLVLADGTLGRILPDIISLTFNSTLNDVGALVMDYPRDGTFAGKLGPFAEVAILINNAEQRNLRFMLMDWDDDVVVEGQDVAVRRWTGVSLMYRLKQTRVNPYPASPLALPRQFPELSPWAKHFMQPFTDAKAREPVPGYHPLGGGELVSGGAYSEITTDFGQFKDSNGADWPQADFYMPEMLASSTLYDVVKMGEGRAEVCVGRNVVRAFIPGTMGHDWTTGVGPNGQPITPFVLARGADLLDGPIRSISGQITTDVMAFGDADRFSQAVDEQAIIDYGVRESSYNARGIARTGTLGKLALTYLRANNGPARNRSFGVVLGLGHDPFVAYDLGDWIWINYDGVPDRMQVTEITYTMAASGVVTATIVANRRVLARDLELMDRIDQINAAQAGLDGGGRPNPDKIPPKAPTWGSGVTLTSEEYDPTYGGARRARLLANWLPVTKDVDNEDCYDLSHYRLYWQYTEGDRGWSTVDIKPDDDGVLLTEATVEDMQPSRAVYVYLTAIDKKGNESAASIVKTEGLPNDRGSFTTIDAEGNVLFSTYEGSVRVANSFRIGDVARSGGPGTPPTGSGGEWTPQGINFFGNLGTLTVKIDAETGDFLCHGRAVFDGDVSVGGVISGGELKVNSVAAENIQANAITSVKIAADAVTAAKIAANTITANEIAASAITTTELAADSVTSSKLTSTAVNGMTLSGVTVSAVHIASATASLPFITSGSNISGSVNIGGNLNVEGSISEGSMRRLKAELKQLTLAEAEQILELPAYTYRKRGNKSAPRQVGWIAEDADGAVDTIVSRDQEGNLAGLSYSRAGVPLAVIAKHHRAQLSEQAERIAALERQVAELLRR